ncbi:hypothetical protein D3C81_2208080 [compost metagenome]
MVRCRKNIMCTRICTTAQTSANRKVAARGKLGNMASPNGTMVSNAASRKPILYDLWLDWLAPALL